MDWFTDLFTQHSAIQAVVVLSLISVFGMMLGKVRFFGISLGVTFVFFIGIAAGHFGLSVDPSMLAFAESFGLVLFVYALGLQVGPGFFNSLRADGLRRAPGCWSWRRTGCLPCRSWEHGSHSRALRPVPNLSGR